MHHLAIFGICLKLVGISLFNLKICWITVSCLSVFLGAVVVWVKRCLLHDEMEGGKPRYCNTASLSPEQPSSSIQGFNTPTKQWLDQTSHKVLWQHIQFLSCRYKLKSSWIKHRIPWGCMVSNWEFSHTKQRESWS